MTEKKLKILILSANPVDKGLLRLSEEAREITEKIGESSVRDKFELIQHWARTPRDLQQTLMRHQPNIVHFSGHGSMAEEVVLEDDEGKSKQLSSQAIASLFRLLKDNVRIVFFDYCFSDAQGSALTDVIDYTLGTKKAISDKAAVNFANAFYQALAFGRSVKEAFQLANLELDFAGIPSSDLPGLLVREGVNDTEPFLSQKKVGQKEFVEKLKPALAHLVTGTSNENERSLIRQGMVDGRVLLEVIEDDEIKIDSPEVLTVMDDRETVYAQVNTSIYQRIQEQLYPSPPGIAPPQPGLIFVGHETALDDVKHLLGVGEERLPAQNPIVVRGWPGVGKSTLVGVIGRDPEVLKTFPDGVLWTSLDRHPELMSKLAEWGRALGTDELLRVPTVDEAAAKLNALLRNKRMLLIVDGIWNSSDVVPFLRSCAGSECALLITTRLTSVAEEIATSEDSIYVLPVLTEENALILLRNLAPLVVEQYPDECRELVRDLEYLPLALHVAGRLLRTEAKLGYNVKDLIAGIRKGADLTPEPAPMDRAEGVTIPTVSALLKSSTDHLDDLTRNCFAFLGVFAPKPATFTLEAMSAVWEVQDPRPIVRKLVGHGLLEHVGTGRFQIHALLVQHARSLLS